MKKFAVALVSTITAVTRASSLKRLPSTELNLDIDPYSGLHDIGMSHYDGEISQGGSKLPSFAVGSH